MFCDVELWYDEYVEECKANGVEPLEMMDWWLDLE